MIDVNVYQENLFHTKMLLKDFDLDNYLFGDATNNLSAEQRAQVSVAGRAFLGRKREAGSIQTGFDGSPI